MTPVVIVGEAYGEHEENLGAAFVGSSGVIMLQMMDEGGLIGLTYDDKDYIRKYWKERDPRYVDMVWRMHPEVYRTNVFNLRPRGNKIDDLCGKREDGIDNLPPLFKSRYVRAEFADELSRLAEELLREDPNVIIAVGNTPTWALLGNGAISQIRGTTNLSTHCVSGFKVLPTFHPAYIMRFWNDRPVGIMDFAKAAREKDYPDIRRPERLVYIPEKLEDIYEFKEQHLDGATQLAVDIETFGRRITSIGFSPNERIALVIPFTRSGNYWKNPASEREAWGIISDILGDKKIKKTFHNGVFDISFLYRAYGIKVYGASDDTMLLHHALHPESLKSLGFLGSIYTDEGAWKRLTKHTGYKQED